MEVIFLLSCLMCWCGIFVSMAVQANIVLTIILCWISGCFAGMLFHRK